MKSIYVILVSFLASRPVFAQIVYCSNTANAAAVTGTIYMQPVQSLRVEYNSSIPIQFAGASDYNSPNGKTYPNYFKVYVTSTIPWVVGVRAMTSQLVSTTGSAGGIPLSVMLLQGRNAQLNFSRFPLSNGVQTLLYSTSNQVQTQHDVDVSFNPGWKYGGGNYSTTLIFTLSPQ